MSSLIIIKQPHITEKAVEASHNGQYTFLVDKNTTKTEVKKKVEQLYKVGVVRVNMITRPGKPKRLGNRLSKTGIQKKAIVTLKKGDKIDIMPQ